MSKACVAAAAAAVAVASGAHLLRLPLEHQEAPEHTRKHRGKGRKSDGKLFPVKLTPPRKIRTVSCDLAAMLFLVGMWDVGCWCSRPPAGTTLWRHARQGACLWS